MQQDEYYEVKEDAYLYPSKLRHPTARKQREEPVRQWCAHELIRRYGISVNDIEFERKVQMASKIHPGPDIAVLRDGRPLVVVECKWRGCKSHDRAMAQAVSYADAQTIRAEYAVYTNGNEWRVKRRIGDRWVPVSDIPREVSRIGTEPITEFLLACDSVAPLLCKLDEAISGEDARRFFSAMQKFFSGVNMLTADVNRNLLIVADNLLRVISLPCEHPNYLLEKLRAAARSLEGYRHRTALGFEIHPVTGHEPVRMEKQYLHCSLLRMVEDNRSAGSSDALVLRLCTAILEYGRHQTHKKNPFPQVGPSLHHALREYLQHALLVNFNVALPDTLDQISNADIRAYCSTAWDNFESDNQATLRDVLRSWYYYFRARLPFGKYRARSVTAHDLLE